MFLFSVFPDRLTRRRLEFGSQRRGLVALLTFLLTFAASLALTGCGGGGGGGGGGSTTARAVLTVSWSGRSRGTLNALSSALSAQVTLVKASPAGNDISFFVNRRADPAAYTDNYTAPADSVVGSWNIQIRFHAQADGAGDVVGTADAPVTMAANGVLPDIATVGLIRTVEVAAGQTTLVGTRQDITFTVRGDGGTIMAVTPGSAFFTVTAGTDRLRINGGQAEGLLPGSALVTANVDGIVSPAIPIVVSSNAVVQVTPTPASVAVGGTVSFTATVANAPTSDVAWAVQEGAAGGSITTGGVYTAPAGQGTYHVIATSQYDPSKQAIVTVTVQAGSANVIIN